MRPITWKSNVLSQLNAQNCRAGAASTSSVHRISCKVVQKIVLLFKLCDEQLSKQSNCDFGLRALKSVLMSKNFDIFGFSRWCAGFCTGNVQRFRIQADGGAENIPQQEILLIQSIVENIAPKLAKEDIPLFQCSFYQRVSLKHKHKMAELVSKSSDSFGFFRAGRTKMNPPKRESRACVIVTGQ